MSFSLVFSCLSRCLFGFCNKDYFFCLVCNKAAQQSCACAVGPCWQQQVSTPSCLVSPGWAGVTAGASPLAMAAGASKEPGILKLESHSIVWWNIDLLSGVFSCLACPG